MQTQWSSSWNYSCQMCTLNWVSEFIYSWYDMQTWTSSNSFEMSHQPISMFSSVPVRWVWKVKRYSLLNYICWFRIQLLTRIIISNSFGSDKICYSLAMHANYMKPKIKRIGALTVHRMWFIWFGFSFSCSKSTQNWYILILCALQHTLSNNNNKR